MDNKQIITNFLEEMSEQNNRITAFPYYYVICDYEYQRSWDDNDGDKVEYLRDGDEGESITLNEYNNLPYEVTYYPEKDPYGMGWQEQYRELRSNKKEVYKGMFLTESDAKDHLKANYYYYHKDAHTYVMAVNRAPKLEQFLTAIFEYFDKPIPPKKYYEKKDAEAGKHKKILLGKCQHCNFENEYELNMLEFVKEKPCPSCSSNTLLNLFEVTTKTVREVKAIKNEPR